MIHPPTEELAKHLTLFYYNRPGRGDIQPYGLEREVEDLGALVAEAGGTAAVYAHSSGGKPSTA